ncbi:MAG: hypothetical protein ACE37J_11820 [Pikeienuella sp.]|uniref:hypothetical protein n=1 Tax=Pikeienuella sp. TaxID=2831957 RepID=UPI00391CB8F8
MNVRTSPDPNYVREAIDAQPFWRAAFALSEMWNDEAPIGWSAYGDEAQRMIRAAADAAALRRAPAAAPDVIDDVVKAIKAGERSPKPEAASGEDALSN